MKTFEELSLLEKETAIAYLVQELEGLVSSGVVNITDSSRLHSIAQDEAREMFYKIENSSLIIYRLVGKARMLN